ncbi:dihydroaeruginoic acid synthetase [Streptomyces sp. Amel2xB2]|uniref:non-ribosomal peptide synthetase n=1 Tax=Streptomyces sp. Amel2xB2 TaxID=1305829 RepID=UPI000DBAD8DE|nr:non-ribosomal peptide synthetase [Streptomyces sp. Amel2xB2]RAJ67160.1 dihydroaeruginoic acid synthetase [Streptomyces sp. Amel2xB2]
MAEEKAWSAERLRDEVSRLLGAELTAADDEADLFALGLQSLQLMQLANRLNRSGAAVDFPELSRRPTLAAWLALLPEDARTPDGDSPATNAPDGPGTAVPDTAPTAELPQDDGPFALTSVQQAYWVGRADGQPLGGVGCHAYLEIDAHGVDPDRLEEAVAALLRQHPMLRARFEDDGTQRVLPVSPWPGLTTHDLRVCEDGGAQRLAALREELSHRRLEVGRGEVFDVRLSLLPGEACRLHVNVDLLVADVHSVRLLLDDLAALYEDPAARRAPASTFARYLSEREEQRAREREQARGYWQARLATLPGGPHLPLAADPGAIEAPRFVRRTRTLPPELWKALRQRAADDGITASVLLATAFSEVLARWSGEHRFTLNVPLFDRNTAEAPDIERIVADFTSLVLLEVDLAPDSGFAARARAVQERLHQDVGQAAYTGVDVLRDLARAEPDSPRTAPVVFACNLEGPLVPESFARRFGELSWMVSQTPQVWLDHQVYGTRDGGVLLAWDAVEELFPDGMVEAMLTAYTALLERLATADSDWNAPPTLSLPEGQRRSRESANSTSRPSRSGTLHGEFFAAAEARADAPALLWGEDGVLTHGELALRARRVAAALRERGVARGSTVAVTVPRGPDQIAAVLGVLAAGAAYVPVGAGQPAARRARIVGRSRAGLVLDGTGSYDEHGGSAGRDRHDGPEGEFAEVPVLPLRTALSAEPYDAAPVDLDPDDVAYVVFTSGSTGQPKGVEISHRSALNTVEDIGARFGIGSGDRVLAVSALDFDLSVWDVFGPLAAGGCAVLVDEADSRDARRWRELCERHGVTVWNSVPALLEMLLTSAGDEGLPPSLRLALLSGDWIGLSIPPRLAAATRGRCRLVAMGGATEAAIWSVFHEVKDVPDSWQSVPYGRPLANQRFRVVDPVGRDCPDWVPGELWIGGAGVALGYRGDPAQTAERFPVVDGERWYRTGDFGRYWPDGTLEFLGRRDEQVKINGFRVELGEVEAALQEDPVIGRAVAVLTEGGELAAAVTVRADVADAPDVPDGTGSADGADGADDTVLAHAARTASDGDDAVLRTLEALAEERAGRAGTGTASGDPLRVGLWGAAPAASSLPPSAVPVALTEHDHVLTAHTGELPMDQAEMRGGARAGTRRPCGVPDALLSGVDVLVARAGRDGTGTGTGSTGTDGTGTDPLPDAATVAACAARLLTPRGELLLSVPDGADGADGWTRQLTEAGFTGVRRAFTGPGGTLLTAHLAESAPAVDPAAVRAALATRLPAHMVPARLTFLSRLPLNDNGKVDRGWIRRILSVRPPAEADGTAPSRQGSAPRGALEETVAALWGEVLGTAVVDRDQGFFASGGDSLQATRLLAAVRARLGTELPMRDMLQGPTVAQMSALAARLGAGVPAPSAEVEEGLL